MGDRSWSEQGVIQLFRNHKHPDVTSLVAGIGDDCAVITPSDKRDYLITADMLVEGVHFDLTFHPPFYLGRKCMAVNLSDIAAMGGKPEFALLSLAIPDHFEKSWLTEFSDGIESILSEFNCILIGGDTVSGAEFACSVTMLGSVLKNRAILRSTAQVGDSIYVSGKLGFGAAGLCMCLEPDQFGPIDSLMASPFIKKHLDPLPDVDCGRILASSDVVTSMQDLSDGLATDLAHICDASNVGACVQAELLPGHDELQQVCEILGNSPVDFQVSGGEDYHLVFTVAAGRESQLEEYMAESGSAKIYRIGTIVEQPGVRLRTGRIERTITFQGYSHGQGKRERI